MRQAQQRLAVYHRPLGAANAGADGFIEHPGRHPAGRAVGEPDIDEIALAACGT
jgi:hypothetical protein